MILDERVEFGDALSVVLTAGAAWQNIGDVYDRGATDNTTVDLGNGKPVYLFINVDTALLAGTGTIEFRLVSDTSDNPPHVSTSTVHFATSTIVTLATSTAGVTSIGTTLVCVALPYGSYERFLGIQTRVLTANTTAGKINAFLTHDVAKWRAYADTTN